MQNERRQKDGTLENFFIVVAAILFSALLIKYRRIIMEIVGILVILILLLVLPIKLIVKVLFSPLKLFYWVSGYESSEMIQEDIIKKYDEIFHKANSKERVAKLMKKIKVKEKVLYEMEKDKKIEEMKKLLDECKWVL